MSTRSQITIIFVLVLATAVPLALSAINPPFGRRGPVVGAYQPIKDLNAPEVQDAAKFAVNEFNKQSKQVNSKSLLQFQKIVKGEYQVVSGINYKLVVSAKDGKSDEQYEAVVYSKPWEKIKELMSFKKV